jgi:hypothetical protein
MRQKSLGEPGKGQHEARLPAGSRLALASMLPGLIMLLIGFVVAVLLGIRLIGVWATVILWCAILAVFVLGLTLLGRRRKKR